MKSEEQTEVIKTVLEATNNLHRIDIEYISKKRFRNSLESFVKFRNICAHDERLYGAKVGGRRNDSFVNLLIELEFVLTRDEYRCLISNLRTLILEYSISNGAKGIAELSDYTLLCEKLGI